MWAVSSTPKRNSRSATSVNSHYAGAFLSHILFCACHRKQRYSPELLGRLWGREPLSAICASLQSSRLSEQFIKSLNLDYSPLSSPSHTCLVQQDPCCVWRRLAVTGKLFRLSVWERLTHRSTVSVVESFPSVCELPTSAMQSWSPPCCLGSAGRCCVWGTTRFMLNQWDPKSENEILFIKQICDAGCAVRAWWQLPLLIKQNVFALMYDWSFCV